jgi:hypothetical protein
MPIQAHHVAKIFDAVKKVKPASIGTNWPTLKNTTILSFSAVGWKVIEDTETSFVFEKNGKRLIFNKITGKYDGEIEIIRPLVSLKPWERMKFGFTIHLPVKEFISTLSEVAGRISRMNINGERIVKVQESKALDFKLSLYLHIHSPSDYDMNLNFFARYYGPQPTLNAVKQALLEKAEGNFEYERLLNLIDKVFATQEHTIQLLTGMLGVKNSRELIRLFQDDLPYLPEFAKRTDWENQKNEFFEYLARLYASVILHRDIWSIDELDDSDRIRLLNAIKKEEEFERIWRDVRRIVLAIPEENIEKVKQELKKLYHPKSLLEINGKILPLVGYLVKAKTRTKTIAQIGKGTSVKCRKKGAKLIPVVEKENKKYAVVNEKLILLGEAARLYGGKFYPLGKLE